MAALHSGKQDFSGYRYQSNGLAWQVLGAGGSRIVEYCKGQDSFDDVIALCAPVAEVQPNIAPTEEIALGRKPMLRLTRRTATSRQVASRLALT